MAENSNIEWCTHTFNPWVGCTKVSPACDNCYAEAWDARGLHGGERRWGPRANRTRTKNWGAPRKWNRLAETTGIRPRVFCASLADVFDNHPSILPEWRRDLWALIKETPHLDWLLLTKRPQNIQRYLPDDWGKGYPNVWLGTTVENQVEADRRIPHLLSIPAAVRFLSCEPLLDHIHLGYIGWPDGKGTARNGWSATLGIEWKNGEMVNAENPSPVHWVITGGESGTNFRESNPDWFRSLRDQCQATGTAFLFKQWHGKNQKEIKAKGRLLDGREHNGYPVTEGIAND